MPKKTRNREAWLTDFVKLAMPLVTQRTGLSQGERSIKISCGFPSGGGKRRKNGGYTSGECHHTHGTDRKHFHIFIHPARVESVHEVGETVLHEVLHVLLPGGVKHRAPFSRAAKQLGLLGERVIDGEVVKGKPTSTILTDELAERVQEWVDELGPYPHEKLEAYGKTQSTRLLKVMCPLCGYVTRTTLKWLEEAGATICPQCKCSMEEGDCPEEEPRLYSVNQTSEFRVRKILTSKLEKPQWDSRWLIRMNRQGDNLDWWLIDFGPAIDEKGMAVLGDLPARLTHAESREHAKEMLEALRDGSTTYEDLDVEDDDPNLEVDDHFYEDEDESSDDPEPYTEEELEAYDENGHKSIAGAKLKEYEDDLTKRIAELERLDG